MFLNALYDATGAVDPSELQAWLDGQTQAMVMEIEGIGVLENSVTA